jgi:hypothetical protein
VKLFDYFIFDCLDGPVIKFTVAKLFYRIADLNPGFLGVMKPDRFQSPDSLSGILLGEQGYPKRTQQNQN